MQRSLKKCVSDVRACVFLNSEFIVRLENFDNRSFRERRIVDSRMKNAFIADALE